MGVLGWVKRTAVLGGALFLGAAGAGGSAAQLKAGEIDHVRSVLDGDTLYLDSGLKVRLSGIQAPKLPLGRKGFRAWPLGQEARSALIGLTQKRRVQLYYGGAKRDRYDRALAQIYILDASGNRDLWVQEEMVRLGMARVYTWPDTFQDSARLYAAEQEARAAARGIWADSFYAIRKPDPDPLAQDVDSFQLVEGIVTSAANVKGTHYLNFGANYRTDFTVAISKASMKAFKKSGFDPLSLEGASIRVRGWIELQNGPVIWVSDPNRIEVLGAPQG